MPKKQDKTAPGVKVNRLQKKAAVTRELWWHAKKDEVHGPLMSWIDKTRGDQSARRSRLAHYFRLYGDRDLARFSAAATPGGRSAMRQASSLDRRLSLNIVANSVDTFVGSQVKERMRATYQSMGGDYRLQRNARKRERLIDGIFYENNVYAQRARAIKMCAITGDGFLRSVPWMGRARIEQVFPGEVLVDLRDAMYGDPMCIAFEHCIDREQAKKLWKGAAKAIEDAPQADKLAYGRDPSSDQIMIFEAYRKASAPGVGDGMHAVIVDGATILAEPYKRTFFELAHWRYSEDPSGYFGTGLGELLTGLQFEINQVLKLIQAGVYNFGNVKIMVPQGTVVDEQIHNSLYGAFIEYTGSRPPQFQVNDVFTPQIFQYLQWLVDISYQITGIGRSAATGEMPAGLAQSGRAQLVYAKQSSERFATFSRVDEQAFLDLARATQAVASDLSQDGEYRVRHVGKRWMDEMNVKEIFSENAESYELQVMASAQLPNDVAGRAALFDFLEQRGYVTRSDVNRNLELGGDIEAEATLRAAPQDLIDLQIERILEDNDLEGNLPDERMDLQLALERGTLAFNRERLLGASEEDIDALSQWLDHVQNLLNPESTTLPADSGQPPALPAPAPTIPGAEMVPPAGPLPPPLPPGAAPPIAA